MSPPYARISTGSTVRFEESERYRVHEGRVVVTDANGTAAHGAGDEFTIAPKGGASVYCLEQAVLYTFTEPPKPKKKPAKKATTKKAKK